MVVLGRVELPTRSLGNCCSIHLSYSPTVFLVGDREAVNSKSSAIRDHSRFFPSGRQRAVSPCVIIFAEPAEAHASVPGGFHARQTPYYRPHRERPRST